MKSWFILSLLISSFGSVYASDAYNCQLINHFQTPDPASVRVACGAKEGFVLKVSPVTDFRVVATDRAGGQRILTLKDLPKSDIGYTMSESYTRIRQWLGDSKYVSFDFQLDPSTELFSDTKAKKSNGVIGVAPVISDEEVAAPEVESLPPKKEGISWSHDEENCQEHEHPKTDVEKVLEQIKEF